MDPYATHIPVTALALARTAERFPDMPILEFGCGDYSTPMIQLLKGGRKHDIYSSDPTWSDKYSGMVDSITKVDEIERLRWGDYELHKVYGLCLLDSEELVKNRTLQVPRLLDVCRVVVMHDAHDRLMDLATYSYMYDFYFPRTWVGSNSIDVREWFA